MEKRGKKLAKAINSIICEKFIRGDVFARY